MKGSILSVLSDTYYTPVELIQVYACHILDKRKTSQLVQKLKRISPMPGLMHLKRVNDGKILVRTSEGTLEECEAFLLANQLEGLSLKPISVRVPKWNPRCRLQYEQASLYWPCNFREDKKLERLLSNKFFTPEEAVVHRYYMKMAARIAAKNDSQVVALIVAPWGKVLSAAIDARHSHSAKHAVMVAIDGVARGEEGGVWDEGEEAYVRAKDCREEGEVEVVKRKRHSDTPYICTGYNVYVTREPCEMCAMALVHARVGMVFYGKPVPWGALGSKCKIHLLNELNHEYAAFSILSEECAALDSQ